MEEVIATIEARVPEEARLGAVFPPPRSGWVYPLYGPRLERRIVYLPAGKALATAGVRAGVSRGRTRRARGSDAPASRGGTARARSRAPLRRAVA